MSEDDVDKPAGPFGKASLEDSAAEARAAAEAAKGKEGLTDKIPPGSQPMPDNPEYTGDPAEATPSDSATEVHETAAEPEEDASSEVTVARAVPADAADSTSSEDTVVRAVPDVATALPDPPAEPPPAEEESSKVEDAKAAAAAAAADAKAKAEDAKAAAARKADDARAAATAKADQARAAASSAAEKIQAPSALQDRPEILIAAAFVGAFLLAKILKRLAG